MDANRDRPTTSETLAGSIALAGMLGFAWGFFLGGAMGAVLILSR